MMHSFILMHYSLTFDPILRFLLEHVSLTQAFVVLEDFLDLMVWRIGVSTEPACLPDSP